MQCAPQLEVKRTFLEFDLHTAIKLAARNRSSSAGRLLERGTQGLSQAPLRSPCKKAWCDESDTASTSAGSSRSRTPSPSCSGHASPRRSSSGDDDAVSRPSLQPCFFWVPVMTTQFSPQPRVASGVTAALQARKAEFGSSVAQLAEAALQAEAAMGAVEGRSWRTQGSTAHQQQRVSTAPRTNTTIMLRNVPKLLTRTMLLTELESQGFAGKFDFVYLPVDLEERGGQGFGHAFVNFVCHDDAARARECFDGFVAWAVECTKPCEALWREQCQGLDAHVQKYRNSALMHESVPDENKPVVFVDGVRCAFPAPTQLIKAPKTRRGPSH